jgi:hypothetical protein
MSLDLKTVEANLAKAKEDVRFWEEALRVLRDPRLAEFLTPKAPANITSFTNITQVDDEPTPIVRPYGELKRRVQAALPPQTGQAVSTAMIVEKMEADGYVFASKTPTISVNEALVNLEKEGIAVVAAQIGPTRFWRNSGQLPSGIRLRQAIENQEPPEGGS